MSQAFYTAIGGISASQKKIDVIADNIANMNTVAFKESNVYFENVFSRTMSLGSGPTNAQGGTNPMQVGLGVQLSSITRNFANGTTQSTGRVSDLYCSGKGFFTVQGGNNEVLLTRAGNFNLDPEGFLVTARGERVLGTDTLFNNEASVDADGNLTPIMIPPALNLRTYGNQDVNNLLNKRIDRNEVNNLSFKDGDFDIEVSVYNAATTTSDVITVNVDITGLNTLQEIIDRVNQRLDQDLEAYDPSVTGNPNAGAGAIRLRPYEPTPGTGSGRLEFFVDRTVDVDNDAANTSVITGITMISRGSDFCDQTGLASAADVTPSDATQDTHRSEIIDFKAEIGPVDDPLTSDSLTVYNISSDGAIDATYSNGDKITVQSISDTGGNTTKSLLYKMPNGAEILQDDIIVNASVISASNLQLQLGSVINEKGLLSEGGNAFALGPNAGELTFSVGNDNGFGAVKNGGLESSNVDLPTQFAEMIVTQRAIEANSRSFDTVSQILQRIIQIGR